MATNTRAIRLNNGKTGTNMITYLPITNSDIVQYGTSTQSVSQVIGTLALAIAQQNDVDEINFSGTTNPKLNIIHENSSYNTSYNFVGTGITTVTYSNDSKGVVINSQNTVTQPSAPSATTFPETSGNAINVVTGLTFNSYGFVSSYTMGKYYVSDANQNALSQNIVSTSKTGTSTADTTENYNTYIVHLNDSSAKSNTYIYGDTTKGIKLSYTKNVGIKIEHSTTGVNGSVGASKSAPASSADITLSSDGKFVIPWVTVDSTGHTTAAGFKTYALPTISSTDKKVEQKTTSANSEFPVLLKASSNNSTETTYVNYDSDGTTNFHYNPSTNVLSVGGDIKVGGISVATKEYVDHSRSSAINICGNVPTGGLPTDGVKVGDAYIVTTAATIDGVGKVEPGDIIIAKSTTPEWTVLQNNLDVATSDKLGTIKIGFSETSGVKNYAVQLDSNNKAFVSVPWTDTLSQNIVSTSKTGTSTSSTTTNANTYIVHLNGSTASSSTYIYGNTAKGITISYSTASGAGGIKIEHNTTGANGSFGASKSAPASTADTTLLNGDKFVIPWFTVDSTGHTTAAGFKTYALPTITDNDTKGKNVIGTSNTASSNATSTTNTTTFLNHVETLGSTTNVVSSHKISGAENVTVTYSSSGLVIKGPKLQKTVSLAYTTFSTEIPDLTTEFLNTLGTESSTATTIVTDAVLTTA